MSKYFEQFRDRQEIVKQYEDNIAIAKKQSKLTEDDVLVEIGYEKYDDNDHPYIEYTKDDNSIIFHKGYSVVKCNGFFVGVALEAILQTLKEMED